VGEGLEGLLAEHVALGVDLELSRAIDHVQEGRAPVTAAPGQTTGDAVRAVGLVARVEGVVRLMDLRDRDDTVELVRKGVEALFAQALELRPAVVHGRRSYRPFREGVRDCESRPA